MTDNTARLSALVTGGAQGIGRAITLAFLRDGMNVLIADRDAEACTEAAAALSRYGNITGLICRAVLKRYAGGLAKHFGDIPDGQFVIDAFRPHRVFQHDQAVGAGRGQDTGAGFRGLADPDASR